jgi:hypothetical protein
MIKKLSLTVKKGVYEGLIKKVLRYLKCLDTLELGSFNEEKNMH